jgi:glutathione synthase/RimK-type ligase-like ATP-grasp enzyme
VLAIHSRLNSFSERWLAQCRAKGIPHTVVDCHDAAIVDRLRCARGLLWHWTHESAVDRLMACAVIRAAESMGLEVFPDTRTCWHFDDKVAQKYLLEAVGAPIARTWTIYGLQSALEFIETARFPLVFKLRRGAGSVNVRLVRSPGEARGLARQAFDRGFIPVGGLLSDVATRVARARHRPDLVAMVTRLPATLYSIRRARKEAPAERGYLYFQEYLPGNEFDTRVTVIGDRAFAFTRNVRKGDFRASGSGAIDYDVARIDRLCLRIAFDISRKLGAQSIAFDFARGEDGDPRILEVSYAYQAEAVHACKGHWDEAMGWHEGHLWPQDAILADFLARLEERSRNALTCESESRP